MKLSDAQLIVDNAITLLSPWCERISVAGSVRRKKPEVKDIEIVCIPKNEQVPDGMFTTKEARCEGFVAAVRRLGYIAKGRPATGKYCWVVMPTIKLDLFMCRPGNWGFILAIRTGSAEFSHKVLGRGWRSAGCHAEDGVVMRNRTDIPVMLYEEQELFDLIGVPFVQPEQRGT
jgi:DNA polymerase/3'-5' exonuclease PolX